MKRFLQTFACVMLALLIVDSAMNDPDVQPLVARQFERAEGKIRSIISWLQADNAQPGNGASGIANDDFAGNAGPASGWYRGTVLFAAAASIWLAGFVLAKHRRHRLAHESSELPPHARLTRRRL